ncbi:hypothetical protein GF325_07090 [Candidatus Bathyarchaeota archaeon]|nr:hypothetical protein [Candidatus Bathyarchaeota archaeon]
MFNDDKKVSSFQKIHVLPASMITIIDTMNASSVQGNQIILQDPCMMEPGEFKVVEIELEPIYCMEKLKALIQVFLDDGEIVSGPWMRRQVHAKGSITNEEERAIKATRLRWDIKKWEGSWRSLELSIFNTGTNTIDDISLTNFPYIKYFMNDTIELKYWNHESGERTPAKREYVPLKEISSLSFTLGGFQEIQVILKLIPDENLREAELLFCLVGGVPGTINGKSFEQCILPQPPMVNWMEGTMDQSGLNDDQLPIGQHFHSILDEFTNEVRELKLKDELKDNITLILNDVGSTRQLILDIFDFWLHMRDTMFNQDELLKEFFDQQDGKLSVMQEKMLDMHHAMKLQGEMLFALVQENLDSVDALKQEISSRAHGAHETTEQVEKITEEIYQSLNSRMENIINLLETHVRETEHHFKDLSTIVKTLENMGHGISQLKRDSKLSIRLQEAFLSFWNDLIEDNKNEFIQELENIANDEEKLEMVEQKLAEITEGEIQGIINIVDGILLEHSEEHPHPRWQRVKNFFGKIKDCLDRPSVKTIRSTVNTGAFINNLSTLIGLCVPGASLSITQFFMKLFGIMF